MTTVNISLPDSLFQVTAQEVKRGGFASVSEYIRTLIRREIKDKADFQLFEKVRLEDVKRGLESIGLYNKKFIDSVVKGLTKSSLYEGKASKN